MRLKSMVPALFVVLWATGFIGAGLSMPHAEPFSFLTYRMVIVFILMGGFAIWQAAPWPKGISIVHSMVIGMLIHSIYLGMVFWSVKRGMPAGVSALIVGLQPLLTALLSGATLGDRITMRHWQGLAIGLIGVALVLGPKFDFQAGGINTITVAASFLAVLAMTAGTVYQKAIASDFDLRTSTCLQYAGAAVLCFIIAASTENFHVEWNTSTLFAMLWLVFVLSIGAVFLLMMLIRDGSVSRVASLFYLVPAVAALMAWMMFDETLTILQIIGMGLCAVAVALATWKMPTRPRAAANVGPGTED